MMECHWLHSLFADSWLKSFPILLCEGQKTVFRNIWEAISCWHGLKWAGMRSGKNGRNPIPDAVFFCIWWFTLWDVIIYCDAVLLIKWKKILGLGDQNKLSLEVRMLALLLQCMNCLGLAFLTYKMVTLNLVMLLEPAKHQKNLRRWLKA